MEHKADNGRVGRNGTTGIVGWNSCQRMEYQAENTCRTAGRWNRRGQRMEQQEVYGTA
jgi:hypothetical protein